MGFSSVVYIMKDICLFKVITFLCGIRFAITVVLSSARDITYEEKVYLLYLSVASS